MGTRSRFRPFAVISAALLCLAVALPVDAATKKRSGPTKKLDEVYRCRDASGQSHMGQNIPPLCMDRDVEVLDKTGRVVRVIPGRESMEQTAAQQSATQAEKNSEQRDRILLATYITVADIERLRDQRLEILEQQSHVTKEYIDNLHERESRLMTDAQRYRPYSGKPKAPPMPDHVAEDIVNTVNGLQVYQQELAKNTAEQDRIRSDFDSDIARFKELKGLN